jgi:hypothetical protein
MRSAARNVNGGILAWFLIEVTLPAVTQFTELLGAGVGAGDDETAALLGEGDTGGVDEGEAVTDWLGVEPWEGEAVSEAVDEGVGLGLARRR